MLLQVQTGKKKDGHEIGVIDPSNLEGKKTISFKVPFHWKDIDKGRKPLLEILSFSSASGCSLTNRIYGLCVCGLSVCGPNRPLKGFPRVFSHFQGTSWLWGQ